MAPSAGAGRTANGGRAERTARHQLILELVARGDIEGQQQLADLLTARGFRVTQATISRDIASLGLVKMFRADLHIYAAPDSVTAVRNDDAMLLRVLRDVDVEVRRSGLILLLVGTPGTASIIAEAIDRSTIDGPEGTIAGDNTVLVLFADDARLQRWRDRFAALQEQTTR